jgi:galactose mutarotase-like enzyme
MFTVTTRPSDSPAFDLVELADTEAASAVLLAPARGAIVTSFRVGDRELFYLDPATLNDVTKNVRGGNPVLFPSPGKLEGDAWSRDGRSGAMKQHGFARTLPWSTRATGTDGAASVTLTLTSSDATRAQYPWDFRADFTFALNAKRLRMTQHVQNTSNSNSHGAMPFGLGFHPYFRVADKSRARIDTRATRAFDNLVKRVVPFTGFDLTQPEVDVHLLDHGSRESAIHLSDGAQIEVRASEEFATWVVWTLAEKDFVCLEPWTCPGNALNTGERLITLSPGEARETWIEIALA